MAALAEKLAIARQGHTNANFWTENYVYSMQKLKGPLTIVPKKTYFMAEKVQKYCASDRTWRRLDVRSSRQGGCGRGWRRG